ncbi:MAG: HK97 family phage prohead protease [Thermogemmata sp.]
MGMTRMESAARTLAVDPQRFTVRAVISTSDPDRAGDVVVPTGLRNLEEYLLNPVVLWAHQRGPIPPIGMWLWLDVQPQRIVAETRFARGLPLAEDIFRLYEQGILRGWSIGFVPREVQREVRPDGSAGLRILSWDLLEYSAVPIPENAAALTLALEKGYIRDRRLQRWFDRYREDVLSPLYLPDVFSERNIHRI